MQLKKRWSQIKRHILLRKVPHAVFSWRYLLANQSPSVCLHKKVFVSAWATLPRAAWVLIALYSYTLWFLFFGWQQLLRVWHNQSPLLQESARVSRFQQFGDLLFLTFGQTTPPFFYYTYQLYLYSKDRWLDFVYTHELPHWHQTWSPDMSDTTQKLMTDKFEFARFLSEHTLPGVEGRLLQPLAPISKEELFRGRSVFLKPQQGSRKQGCFILHFHEQTNSYSLMDEVQKTITRRSEILDFLQSRVDKEAYLLQPLLVNHAELSQICPSDHLITFRIVTAIIGATAKVISAILEWPKQAHSIVIYPVQIDVESGKLKQIRTRFSNQEEIPESLLKIGGTSLPYWPELKATAEKTHLHFPDLLTIGWDLVLTTDGVKILEGNINWGVDNHQLNAPNLLPYYQQLLASDNQEIK
jgi:hypothetical protein